MRSNMDPLSPATSTLSPAISHIAEISSGFVEELPTIGHDDHMNNSRDESQVRKVEWVLQTPNRLQNLFAAGRRQDALDDWASIKATLYRWNQPPGSEPLQLACQKIIDDHVNETESSDDDV
jgi:vacuolar protein sorting-associated protein 51